MGRLTGKHPIRLPKIAKTAILILMSRFLENWRARFAEDPSWAFFLLFAFFAMVSMPMARVSLVLSLVTLLCGRESRRTFRMTAPTAGWLAYLAVAIVISAAMAWIDPDPLIDPRRGFSKLTKLLWFVAIPVAAAQVRTAWRFRETVVAVVAGGLVIAFSVIFLHTSYAWLQVSLPKVEAGGDAPAVARGLYRAISALGLRDFVFRCLSSEMWKLWGGYPPSFFHALTSNETLHGAQRLMVALLAATALSLSAPAGARRPLLARIAPFVIAFALVVTCKRGSLGAAVVAEALLVVAVSRPWKALVAVVALVALALAVPQSRARIATIPSEFTLMVPKVRSGGRALMWVVIVPELHRQHPWGIGFRSLTDRKMRSIDWHVEPNRTHVHSTPLQAFVDFSWFGLAAWALWMALSLRAALRVAAAPPGAAAELAPPLRFLPLVGFVALFLVSLVEYNIADAAVVMLYGIILGLVSPSLARQTAQPDHCPPASPPTINP